MENISDKKEMELLFIIANYGLGSKLVKSAKQNGVSGGTIFLGKGTIRNHLLELLDLTDVRKEVVLMVSEKTIVHDTLEKLNREFHFNKPNHGIAFSIPISGLFGCRSYSHTNIEEVRGVKNTMHNAIFVVVDRGKAQDAVEAATKAGSRGATIINARGSGLHEVHKLFSMEIEPEKELVLILSETHLTEAITMAIRNEIQIDEPGNGIIFVVDTNKTYGLY